MVASNIMNIFAKSPLKPIEEHIRLAHKASELLIEFFDVVYDEDWKKAESIYQNIASKEREADKLKRDVRLQLSRGLFMPVERSDLLELVTQQDRIANRAKDIAGRVIGRQMLVPKQIRDQFKEYIERCVDATNQSCIVINEFDALLENSFKGREVTIVEALVHKIHDIEADTDQMEINLRLAVKKIENEYNPLDIMFLYSIIDWVGNLADLAEKVGSRLELMLVR